MTQDPFARLAAHLPQTMGSLRLEGLNSMLRLYRYSPSQRFPPHMDHCYRPADTRITLHTVLAFNDDFEGGETRSSEQLDSTVQPKPGHRRRDACQMVSSRLERAILQRGVWSPSFSSSWTATSGISRVASASPRAH